MFNVSDFLDRAKAGAGDVTDYRLAQLIGVSQSAVSQYRTGARMPDPRVIVRLCDYSGDDAEHVIACVQSMRAANDEEAALWQRIADRLRRSSLSLAGATAIALAAGSAGLTPAGAEAAPLLHDAGGGLCIMSTLLLAWLLLSRQRITTPGIGTFPRV